MKIYRPVKTNQISQLFGENKPCAAIKPDGTAVIPYVIRSFVNDICIAGFVKFYPLIKLKGHNGVDLGAYAGEPVYFNVDAPTEWEAATEIDRDGGIGVRVRSKSPIPLTSLPKELVGSLNLAKRQYESLGGIYITFLFWHLSKVNVYDKQPVKMGQCIGFAGSTGASSGTHVHFAPKATDATSWFTIDGDNGYTGAFDPMPWYENTFVLDVVNVMERANVAIEMAKKVISLVTEYLRLRRP